MKLKEVEITIDFDVFDTKSESDFIPVMDCWKQMIA
jgi:hypothetical protein